MAFACSHMTKIPHPQCGYLCSEEAAQTAEIRDRDHTLRNSLQQETTSTVCGYQLYSLVPIPFARVIAAGTPENEARYQPQKYGLVK